MFRGFYSGETQHLPIGKSKQTNARAEHF